MRKSILSFTGSFDRAKAELYVARSRQEHHFGHPEPVEDGQLFRVRFEKGSRGPIQVYSHTSQDRYVLRRTAADARRTPAREFAISFVESGSMSLTQAGTTVTVGAGQMALLSMNLPYVVEHLPTEVEVFRVIFTHLPGHDVDPHGNLIKGPTLIHSREKGAIKRLLLLLFEFGDQLEISTSRDLFRLMIDKMREAFNLGEHVALSGNGDEKFENLVQYIRHNFSDRFLDLQAAAFALSVSPRTINYITRQSGTTFAKILWETRIAAVRAWLQNPKMSAMTIEHMAVAAGFKSASHLSTMFKARLNVSPRAYRSISNPAFTT